MNEVAAAVTTGLPVKGGLEFVWLISFGQVLTIALALVGGIMAVGKLVATVFSVNKQVDALRKDVQTLQTSFSAFTTTLLATQLAKLHDLTKEENDE